MNRWLFPLLLLATASAAPFDPFGAADIDERPGAAIPLDTPLRDQHGATTSLRRIAAGRPLLIAPVLHNCANFCGVTLDGLAAAIENAPVDAAIVALGIDPREDVEAARGDLQRLAMRHPAVARRITATVGDAATITDALGYRYAFDPRIGQYAHAAAVAVITPDGRLSRWLYGIAPQPGAVRDAVARARAGKAGGVVQRLILLCYHYDPATGRYGLAIDRALIAGCLATVLLVGGYVVRARWKERRA